MSNKAHSRSTKFEEEEFETTSVKNRHQKSGKASQRKSTRKQSGGSSRSASERSIDTDITDIPAGKAVPKAKLLTKLTQDANWYKLAMGTFFLGVSALMILFKMMLWSVQNSSETGAEVDFSTRKNPSWNNVYSIVGWFINQFYYQANGFFFGGLDLLQIFFGICLVLDDDQKELVQFNSRIIQETVKRVGPAKLRNPLNPDRKEIEQAQSVINKLVGGRRFKIRIMKIEAIKEVFSLDIMTHALFHLFRLLVKFVSPLPTSYNHELDLFFEGILLCFLHYKNIVYYCHRVGQRPELHTNRTVMVFVSFLLFFLRVVCLFEFFMLANNLVLGLTMVVISYLGYRLADFFNDRHLINNIRNNLFLGLNAYS